MSALPSVTVRSFEAEVLQAATPVLVDFWASWCQPCRQIAPILEALAVERVGSLSVVKVDIDANPELAERYKVRSIPMLALFDHGELIQTIIGAMPKAEIVRQLDDALG